jgi:hypothetical protein
MPAPKNRQNSPTSSRLSQISTLPGPLPVKLIAIVRPTSTSRTGSRSRRAVLAAWQRRHAGRLERFGTSSW